MKSCSNVRRLNIKTDKAPYDPSMWGMGALRMFCFRMLLAYAIIGLPACAPTTQLRTDLIRGDIRLSKDWGGEMSVSLHTPSLDVAQQGEIDTRSSFVRDSQGRRYGLVAEKISFVESYPEKSCFLQRRLRCLSPSGQSLPAWANGHWKFHVVRRFPGGIETYDVAFKLFTRFWTPLSGAPN
jgi:hypothetical protein